MDWEKFDISVSLLGHRYYIAVSCIFGLGLEKGIKFERNKNLNRRKSQPFFPLEFFSLTFLSSAYIVPAKQPRKKKGKSTIDRRRQAGAELAQAQLKLGLGFTSTIDSK